MFPDTGSSTPLPAVFLSFLLQPTITTALCVAQHLFCVSLHHVSPVPHARPMLVWSAELCSRMSGRDEVGQLPRSPPHRPLDGLRRASRGFLLGRHADPLALPNASPLTQRPPQRRWA
ncbi:hypothetical protein F4823DRAFT_490131 [Ustulina deusta]|nr:hypothetical protein F4823DRAFT_490131 [Ustulina deusta]